MTTTTTTTASDVLLYVPNLIGYARIALTGTSLALMVTAPAFWLLAITLYIASFVGDLVDGIAARALQQQSSFGGVLDMITDRCSTLGLLMVLMVEYGNNNGKMAGNAVVDTASATYRIIFMTLALLDIASHWLQMHSSLAIAAAHHKSDQGNVGRHCLVRWFYQYYWFFGYLCVGAEFTYILAYARLHATSRWLRQVVHVGLWAGLPGCVAKQAVNLSQLLSACYLIAKHDADLKSKQSR